MISTATALLSNRATYLHLLCLVLLVLLSIRVWQIRKASTVQAIAEASATESLINLQEIMSAESDHLLMQINRTVSDYESPTNIRTLESAFKLQQIHERLVTAIDSLFYSYQALRVNSRHILNLYAKAKQEFSALDWIEKDKANSIMETLTYNDSIFVEPLFAIGMPQKNIVYQTLKTQVAIFYQTGLQYFNTKIGLGRIIESSWIPILLVNTINPKVNEPFTADFVLASSMFLYEQHVWVNNQEFPLNQGSAHYTNRFEHSGKYPLHIRISHRNQDTWKVDTFEKTIVVNVD